MIRGQVEQQCKDKATATAKDVPLYEHFYTQAKCGHDLQRQVYADDTDHAEWGAIFMVVGTCVVALYVEHRVYHQRHGLEHRGKQEKD